MKQMALFVLIFAAAPAMGQPLGDVHVLGKYVSKDDTWMTMSRKKDGKEIKIAITPSTLVFYDGQRSTLAKLKKDQVIRCTYHVLGEDQKTAVVIRIYDDTEPPTK